MSIYQKVQAAGAKAMATLSIGAHESDAWAAVEAPYIEFLNMVAGNWSLAEIDESINDGSGDFQYAGFNAAHSELMKHKEDYSNECIQAKHDELKADQSLHDIESEGDRQVAEALDDIESGLL